MIVFTRDSGSGAWIERTPRADAVVITDELNERSTASVVLFDAAGTAHFRRGTNVRITDATPTTIFEGFVERVTEARLGMGGTREHQLDCVDQHYLADKRVVAAAFTDTSAGGIVNALITSYLAAEGVTAGVIDPGPTVRAITFNYVTVADAVQELALRAGFWWRITHDRVLHFQEPGAFLAALAGSESIPAGSESVMAGGEGTTGGASALDLPAVALADSVSVSRASPSYRNRQWVRGGTDRTSTQVETQYGDGERRAFLVGYPIAEAPVVTVDRGSGFVTETVGESGVDSGQQWSYSVGSNVITQASGQTLLTTTGRVRVTYVGTFDVVARVQDETLQVERAVAEGGTGIIERVLLDRSTDNRDAAFQLAGELLSYFGRPAIVVRFATASVAFEPGQVWGLSFAEAGIVAEDALVTTVEWFTRSGVDHAVVTLAIGPMEGSWAQWFGALSKRIDRASERAGGQVDVVTTLESFSKLWVAVEVPNIFYVAFPGASTFPAAALIAAFEHEDRVRFLAWSFGGVELGRKAFTLQTGAASDEVFTSTTLGVNDAVGDIDELAWIGGAQATAAAGSGVEVDRQAFVKTKLDIEQVVVEKTDTKWA